MVSNWQSIAFLNVLPRGRILAAAVLAVMLAVPAGAEEGFDPEALLLTWQRDPTTTMTIDWHTPEGDTEDRMLEYRHLDAEQWRRAEPEQHPFPFTERTIHRVELTDLEPGATYLFRIGDEGRRFRFRTVPADTVRPIRFAAGGDTRHRQDWMERTNRQAARYDVDFIVWGGDLAYADGREDRLYRWDEWFAAIRNTLVTEEGRVIPVILGIGNHEVRGGYYRQHDDFEPTDAWRARIAPYYYGLFAFPGQPGYGVLDFGDYLSIPLLDTAHTNPIEGEQTEWLAETLEARGHVPFVFPVYHVPAYPSHRSFEGSISRAVREHWVPLFERYGIHFAFENHDHTYKRTHPIRDGEVDPSGIVYLGDGAWGVGTRSVHPVEETWYLAEAASARHLILATLQGRTVRFTMIDEDGNVIDEFPEAPEPIEAAPASSAE